MLLARIFRFGVRIQFLVSLSDRFISVMNSTRPRGTILSPPRVRCWIWLGPTPSPLRTVFPVEPQESGKLYCSVVHLKKDLFNHYLYLTKSVYDVDIPQTFKSVCAISATIVGHWTACSIVCVLDFLLMSSPILLLRFSFFFCCF